MIKVSDAYLEAIKQLSREFSNSVTFTSGANKKQYSGCDIKIDEIFSENNEAMSIGKAFSQKVSLKVYEPETPFNYSASKIEVTCGLKVGDKFENVPLGVFYTSEIKTNDDYFTMQVTGYDRMSVLLQTKYEPKVTLPTTDAKIIEDICTQYHLEKDLTPLNRTVDKIFEGTVAETLGYMAGLQGKNAIFNRYGKLVFRGYPDVLTYEELESYLYEKFYPYTYDEIEFSDISWVKSGDTDEYEMDRSEQKENGVEVSAENMIRIESITSGTKENVLVAGSGRGITFLNPYITQEEVTKIFETYKGVNYYSGKLSTFGSPTIEVGDMIYTKDNKDNDMVFLVSSQSLEVNSGFSAVITSSGSGDTEINFDNIKSPSEKKLDQAKSDLQKAIEDNSAFINGARGGVYAVTDNNGDGINDGWYIADNEDPQLRTKYIVANVNGIGLSNDGDTVYEQAITHEGINASAITTGELNADIIKAGTLSSRDEKTFTLNLDTGDTCINSGKINLTGVGKGEADIINISTADKLYQAYLNPFCFTNVKWTTENEQDKRFDTYAYFGAALGDDPDWGISTVMQMATQGDIATNNADSEINMWTRNTESVLEMASKYGIKETKNVYIYAKENKSGQFVNNMGNSAGFYVDASGAHIRLGKFPFRFDVDVSSSKTYIMIGSSNNHFVEVTCTPNSPTRVVVDGITRL